MDKIERINIGEKIKKIVKILYILAILILVCVFFIAFNYAKDTVATKEITYNEFINLLEKNQVSKVVIENENLIVTPSENNEEYKGKTLFTANINDRNLISELKEANVKFEWKNTKDNSINIISFWWVIPLVIIFFIWKYIKLKKENKYLLAQIKELTEKKDNNIIKDEKSEN